MGGGPELFDVPPPKPMFPGATKEYKNLVSGQGLETIGKTLRPGEATELGYTPDESGYSVDFDAKRMADVLEAGRSRQVARGRSNVLESFGQMGLRSSSPAVQGLVDYEAEVAKTYLGELQRLELGLVPLRLEESEAEKTRGFQALLAQAGLTEAGKIRDVNIGFTWLAALSDMGLSFYSSKALVNRPSILQQIMGGAQAAMDIASTYLSFKGD